jgi:hypothetical protein
MDVGIVNKLAMLYVVPPTFVSNLMMASQETAETCSWYAIVHTNIVVFFDCYS